MTKLLPQRFSIDAFGNGGFRFGGYSHVGSLLVLPSGMRAWGAVDVAALASEDFSAVVDEVEGFDFLLVGTGQAMVPLPKVVLSYFSAKGIRSEAMSTSSAVHTYNVVVGEGRRVAAALLAVT